MIVNRNSIALPASKAISSRWPVCKSSSRTRAVNLEEMEAAVVEQLAEENLCAPWRTSETERAGCREGMRLAALQFLSQYREAIGNLSLNRPPFRRCVEYLGKTFEYLGGIPSSWAKRLFRHF